MKKYPMNIPMEFNPAGYGDLVGEFLRQAPKDVEGISNTSAIYYRQWMLKKVFGVFEFSGMPETWDRDYFLQTLFLDGKIAITDTDLGILPLQCGITGINVFNHPTEVQIANPILGSFRRKIDVDCVLLKLQYNYCGIGYMLDRYASLLAMCDSSIAVNLMNSKVTFIAMASSKAQSESMKKMYDDISKGNPAVFVKGDQINEESVFYNHVKQNFVCDDIQIVKRKIVNEFLTEIGINNANMDKRERLVADEVAANDDEVLTNVQHWLDNIQEGLNAANKMFALNLKVNRREYLSNNQNYLSKTEDIQNESAKLN